MPGPTANDPDLLRAFAPFDRMTGQDYRSLRRVVETLELRRGKALYYQGDRPERCWLLLAGSIRGLMYRSDGSALSLGNWTAGDWLGVAECILDGPFLNDAVADVSCMLAGFTHASFQRLLALPDMREFFLREMARRYYAMHSRMELATPMDRLIGYLVDGTETPNDEGPEAQGPHGNEPPRLAVTQDQIAEAIGASRETVNRHLRQLAARGTIRIGRGSLQIVDAAALRKLRDGGWQARS